MNEIELSMMRGMVSVLNAASEAYYNGKTPLMSDKMFDMRLEDLKRFEEETGFVFSNSPTQRVGAMVLTELNEVAHTSPMLSLDKCHNVTELLKFINNKETVASIKLDGLTCRLTYEDGVLVRAETRGDGYSGSDVTEHVKHFLNVPMNIDKTGTYTVDGEAIITDEDFAEINKNNEYKNSRNLASGTLAVLDTSLVAKRRLRFMLWDVVKGGSNSLKGNLNEAKKLYFDVVPFWFVPNSSNALNPKNLQSNIDYVFEFAKNNGFPCDGIVFKFNDIEYGKSLGATSHHFRNGIAYKAKDEVYETELIDIEFTMGKTGVLTPTAVFKPVGISGSIVERASVHNMSILSKLDLHIGDTIEVVKANSIIPQVKRNVSADERMALCKEPECVAFPENCPVCGGKTELVTENSSTVLVCTNDNCKGKLLGKLTRFVSKNAMNIDGLSEATLEKFIELGWLTCFEDIYHLDVERDQMMKLDGFGEKSVRNLFTSIHKSTDTTLDRFIYALSIPLIGRSASKTISKHFNGDFNRFYKACCIDGFDFTVLDDFGEAMNDSINDYMEKNVVMVGNLAKEMSFEEMQIASSSNALAGKVFCITGSLNHFANRDEAKEQIEAAGGKVSGSVSAKTSYLVNNDAESTSGKNKKAKELNIPIISEEELIKMLN
jgi:DNA ligase (NAD+)